MSKRQINRADTLQLLESLGEKMGLASSGNAFGFRYRIETKYLLDFLLPDEFELFEEPTTGRTQVTYYKHNGGTHYGGSSNARPRQYSGRA